MDLPIELPAPMERVALRRSRGISLRVAAGYLSVWPSTLMRWEAGATPREPHRTIYAGFLQRLRDGSL